MKQIEKDAYSIIGSTIKPIKKGTNISRERAKEHLQSRNLPVDKLPPRLGP